VVPWVRHALVSRDILIRPRVQRRRKTGDGGLRLPGPIEREPRFGSRIRSRDTIFLAIDSDGSNRPLRARHQAAHIIRKGPVGYQHNRIRIGQVRLASRVSVHKGERTKIRVMDRRVRIKIRILRSLVVLQVASAWVTGASARIASMLPETLSAPHWCRLTDAGKPWDHT
jgi:hypothetical protein